MFNFQAVARIVLLGNAIALGGNVFGQTYPNKPVRIVTGGVGTGVDIVARMIGPTLSASLGQPVVVENHGGSTVTSVMIVARATPDGYTVLFYNGSVWLLPLLQDSVPYDPVKDFSPVTLADTSPTFLVVHPSLPVKSVKDLIALAHARPGELNYASSGSGGAAHLAAELFKTMAAVNFVRVNYKGSGAALIGLVGNQVQLMFPSAGAVATYIKAGRLRALAVGSKRPSALAPDLPTIAASGLPGYELESVHAILAPMKTPAPVIKRLNEDLVSVFTRTEMREKLLGNGVEAVGSSSQELGVAIKSEMARLGRVIKDAGIRGE